MKMIITFGSFSGICSSPVERAHSQCLIRRASAPRNPENPSDYRRASASASRDRAKIPTADFGGIEERGSTSIRHASVGSIEAANEVVARLGVIDV